MTSRLTLVLLVVSVSATPALGQVRAAGSTVLPPIGLPLAPIGVPLAPLGVPSSATDPFDRDGFRMWSPVDSMSGERAGGHHPAPRPHPASRHRGASAPAVVYIVPVWGAWPYGPAWPYGLGAPAPGLRVSASEHRGTPATSLPAPHTPAPEHPNASVPVPSSIPASRTSGVLYLELEPSRDVSVFVDGYYVGRLEELGTGIALEPGPHHLQAQAEGYEPLRLDVKIAGGRATTFRGSLTPQAGPPRSSEPAPVPSTFYFIPGCYLGNVDPRTVNLPADCDLSKMVTKTP